MSYKRQEWILIVDHDEDSQMKGVVFSDHILKAMSDKTEKRLNRIHVRELMTKPAIVLKMSDTLGQLDSAIRDESVAFVENERGVIVAALNKVDLAKVVSAWHHVHAQ